jgi:hypothetical protein
MKRLWEWVKEDAHWVFVLMGIVAALWMIGGVQTIVINCSMPALDRRLQSVEAQVDSIKTVVWQDGYTTAMCEAIEIVKEYKAGLLNANDTLPAMPKYNDSLPPSAYGGDTTGHYRVKP